MSNSAQVQKRLDNEQKILTDNNFIIVKDKDSPELWRINFVGPELSPFEGGLFVLKFNIAGFPFKPPVVAFQTKIYHPNVDKDGSICGEMLELGDQWAPVKKLISIMEKIRSLMIMPNLKSPLNQEAADDYSNGKWEIKARKQTSQYAK